MASLQAALDEEEEDLCPVCIEAPPRVACDPCGHQMCVECLNLWRQTSASYYAATKNGADANRTTCPMCRTEILGYRQVSEAEVASTSALRKHGRARVVTSSAKAEAQDAAALGDDSAAEDMSIAGDRRKASRGQRARSKKKSAGIDGGEVDDCDGYGAPESYRGKT
jgi:hypothetical protein